MNTQAIFTKFNRAKALALVDNVVYAVNPKLNVHHGAYERPYSEVYRSASSADGAAACSERVNVDQKQVE